MANPEHLARLKQGVAVWNRWRAANAEPALDLAMADLTGADLSNVDLRRADLAEADLTKANLRYANLTNAHLTRANLTEADLKGVYLHRALLREAGLSRANLLNARLSKADLRRADLCGANLTEALLVGTDFRWANLTGACLTKAAVDGTNFTGADLSKADFTKAVFREAVLGDCYLGSAIGLDTCQHDGPSTIDHRTLTRSGPLPLVFLRGCGLPDRLIDYLRSLLNQPIQFYSCFISYSTKDQSFADRLHADLQNKGVRCWFAPHDIQGGKKIQEQIDEAIRVYDRLLLILSAHSINSEWVKTEIAKARKRELREQRRMLFPIRLVDFATLRDWECFDADTGKDSAREIREYFVPDFSEWKTNHDHYETALERLLKDLKPVP